MTFFNQIDFTNPQLKLNQVYSTKDYSALWQHRLNSNRDLIPSHIKNIRDNLAEHMQIAPVIFSEQGVIIDGQHRLKACEDLKIPVDILLRDISDPEQAQKNVNAVSKNWGVLDYIHNGASQNKIGYQDTLDLVNEYLITPGTIQHLRIITTMKFAAFAAGESIKFTTTIKQAKTRLDLFMLFKEWVNTRYKKAPPAAFERMLGKLFKAEKQSPALFKEANFSWKRILRNLDKGNVAIDPNTGKNFDLLAQSNCAQLLQRSLNYQRPAKDKTHVIVAML